MALFRGIAIDLLILTGLLLPIVAIAWIRYPVNLMQSLPYFLPLYAVVIVADAVRLLRKAKRSQT